MINAGLKILPYDGSQTFDSAEGEWQNVKVLPVYPEGQNENVNPIKKEDYVFEPNGNIWVVTYTFKSSDFTNTNLKLYGKTGGPEIAPDFGLTDRGAVLTPTLDVLTGTFKEELVDPVVARLVTLNIPKIQQAILLSKFDKEKLDKVRFKDNGVLSEEESLDILGREVSWDEDNVAGAIGFRKATESEEAYLYFLTKNNVDGKIKWVHKTDDVEDLQEWMALEKGRLTVEGQEVYHEGNLPQNNVTWFYAGVNSENGVKNTYINYPKGTLVSYQQRRAHSWKTGNGWRTGITYMRRFLEKTGGVGSTSWRHV